MTTPAKVFAPETLGGGLGVAEEGGGGDVRENQTKQNKSEKKKAAAVTGKEVEDRNHPSETAAPEGAGALTGEQQG